MRFFQAQLWLILILLTGLASQTGTALAQDTGDAATPETTPAFINCGVQPEGTPSAEMMETSEAALTPEVTPSTDTTATEEPASEMSPTEEPTVVEPTVTGIQDPDAPLHFVSFLPTDLQFNPDAENPAVTIMVFSLIFENQLGQSIGVTSPKFQLTLDGVPWGDVASTDFQMGQLLGHATQGIVLQSLTFYNNASDDQKIVFECIKHSLPVDLTLTGTIQVAVDGQEQTIQVELTSPQVIIQSRKPKS